ncbi:MAG: RNA polymerase sigma factor [Chloroflexota bacterium]
MPTHLSLQPQIDYFVSSDEALIEKVQHDAKNSLAFAELYRRYRKDVYRFLLTRLSTNEDAQDVTSQTFITALETITKFGGRSSFKTWLLGIARNLAADHLRRQRPTAQLSEIEGLRHTTPSLDETVAQSIQLDKVVQTMRILSPDRAKALTLHSFKGLTVAQVANVMEKKEPAVRMLIHRAIRDIQQRMPASI